VKDKNILRLFICFFFHSFYLQSVFVLCVIGVIAGIYTLRTVLYQEIGSDAQIIASILNVIQIQVLTYVYDHLAFKLTDLENRRNDVLYEDSMIIKLFLFQFVNNYSSFYYLAFIAGSLPVPNGANKDSRVSYRILAFEIIFLHFIVAILFTT
jgi:hypothetical protein